MNLRRKRRSAEVSLDECREMEEGWLLREVTDRRATPEESCSQQELYRLLAGVIEQLRPSHRVIVHLRYVKGFSAGGDIAAARSSSVNGQGSTAPRAIASARDIQATLPKKVRCAQSVISIEYVFPRKEELRAPHRRSVTRFGRMSLILLRVIGLTQLIAVLHRLERDPASQESSGQAACSYVRLNNSCFHYRYK